MNYDRLADRKSELEKEIDMLWDAADQEAVEHYGDIHEWASSEQMNRMLSEFVDHDKLHEIESEWEEINSELMSIEHNQGWH